MLVFLLCRIWQEGIQIVGCQAVIILIIILFTFLNEFVDRLVNIHDGLMPYFV